MSERTVKVRGKVYVETDPAGVRKGDVLDYVEGTVSKHRRTHFVEAGLAKRKGAMNVTVRLHPHEGGGLRKVDLRSVVRAWRWRGASGDDVSHATATSSHIVPPEKLPDRPPLTTLQERVLGLALERGHARDMTHGEYCAVVQLHKMGLLVLERPSRDVSPAPAPVPEGEEEGMD